MLCHRRVRRLARARVRRRGHGPCGVRRCGARLPDGLAAAGNGDPLRTRDRVDHRLGGGKGPDEAGCVDRDSLHHNDGAGDSLHRLDENLQRGSVRVFIRQRALGHQCGTPRHRWIEPAGAGTAPAVLEGAVFYRLRSGDGRSLRRSGPAHLLSPIDARCPHRGGVIENRRGYSGLCDDSDSRFDGLSTDSQPHDTDTLFRHHRRDDCCGRRLDFRHMGRSLRPRDRASRHHDFLPGCALLPETPATARRRPIAG